MLGAVIFILIMATTFMLGYSFAMIRHQNEKIELLNENIKRLEEIEVLMNENNHLQNHVVPLFVKRIAIKSLKVLLSALLKQTVKSLFGISSSGVLESDIEPGTVFCSLVIDFFGRFLLLGIFLPNFDFVSRKEFRFFSRLPISKTEK